MLRMLVGEIDPDAALPETPCAEVAVLECNVDDATPQALAFAAKRLLSAGALDVFTAPVTMKKGRQGHQLTVLARPHDLGRLSRQMLRDTPTLGLRYRLERRFELERRTRGVETVYGPVEVKIGTLNGRVLRVWPEYETCATLAERCGASLWEVQQAALAAFAATPEGKRTRTDSVTEGDSS